MTKDYEAAHGVARIELAKAKEEIASLRAEIERLKEQLASLQASSGYEASIMQLEIERLEAVLRCISGMGAVDCDEAPGLARRALEPKP